ncbi:MAG: type I DNA topoisomerase [Candidatus Bathyarchaeota archaeon]|nr:type I DNA topoisomerase [Candidatus Bathyarchaeota archaeon]
MDLIIVESPTKAKTIKRFVKKGLTIISTFGHIRDLPKTRLGVDVDKDFTPQYVIPTKARKRISEIKKYLPTAKKIILATDEDREGEAIAWHFCETLKLPCAKTKEDVTSQPPGTNDKQVERIVFHEITPQAIKKALQTSRAIDINLVNAQQARRILDRLVGYKLSPLLWKKIKRGLSAGRVQSVAVRLICDREQEIKEFKAQEYWIIEGVLGAVEDDIGREVTARLYKRNNEIMSKLTIQSKKEAEGLINALEKLQYKVSKIEKIDKIQNPLPPFTTSLLQQTAWQKFRFPARFTMGIAQNLYERGFITYHRTDSFNLASQSLSLAREVIERKFGREYWAGYPRRYKIKSKSAQEAHEAIRPTFPAKEIDEVKKDLKEVEQNLYDLIWRRFIASQMATAQVEETKIIVISEKEKNTKDTYEFLAEGKIIRFDGFFKVYPLKFKEKNVPEFTENEPLKLKKLIPSQRWTLPPRRYNEGSLVKTLERYGVGRPSTYAPIITLIQRRGYIEKDKKRYFRPTEIGGIVNNLLTLHFPNIVDIKFTAKMEKNLDKIANGKTQWRTVLKDFYFPFEKNLKKKEQEIEKETGRETTEICPQCKKNLIIRWSRYGKFLACSGFPQCKYTQSLSTQKKDHEDDQQT